MPCHTFDLSAFHRAIWTVRERSRACGCVHTRQKLLGLERTLLSLLMEAERTRPGFPPVPSAPPPVKPSSAELVAVDAAPAKTGDTLPGQTPPLRTVARAAPLLGKAAALRGPVLLDQARTMRAGREARRERAGRTRYRLRKAGDGTAAADHPHTSASDNASA